MARTDHTPAMALRTNMASELVRMGFDLIDLYAAVERKQLLPLESTVHDSPIEPLTYGHMEFELPPW